MSFKISKDQSTFFKLFKYLFILIVMIGHINAFVIPKFETLDIYKINDFSRGVFKFLFSTGREAAFLFIFLSGFFTASSITNRGNNYKNLFFELRNRLKRIYPTYTFALLLTIILDSIGLYYFDFEIYHINPFSNVNDSFNLKNLFLNCLSLQPILSDSFGSNGPLWTLGYLVQFYFITIFIKMIAIKTKINLYKLILLLISFFTLINIEFSLLFLVWVSGMYLKKRELYFNFKIMKNSLFLMFVLFFIIYLSKLSLNYISILLTPLSGYVLLMFSKTIDNQSKFNFLRTRFVQNIPDIGYELYASHMPIIFFTFGILNHFKFGLSNFFYAVFTDVIVIIVCVLFALLIKKISE